MRNVKKKISEFSRAAWSSCPYTTLGKKTVGYVRGKKQDGITPITGGENNMIMKIKMGRNIALIGFFCPFFWIAFFSGATGQTLYFNAIHSGVVMAIGLGIMAVYGFRIVQLRNKLSRVPEPAEPSINEGGGEP